MTKTAKYEMERRAAECEQAAYYHETAGRHSRRAAEAWRAAIAKAEGRNVA